MSAAPSLILPALFNWGFHMQLSVHLLLILRQMSSYSASYNHPLLLFSNRYGARINKVAEGNTTTILRLPDLGCQGLEFDPRRNALYFMVSVVLRKSHCIAQLVFLACVISTDNTFHLTPPKCFTYFHFFLFPGLWRE